jgi:protein CpxP
MTPFSFRRISAAAIFALSLVPAGAAIAQVTQGSPTQLPPSGGFGRGRMGAGYGQPELPLELLVRELNLTDAQRASVNTLLADEHKTQRAQLDPLRQAHQALDAAIMNVPADDGQLQAQVQQVSAIEAQLALSHARMQAKIFQLLNPEQQARARDLVSQRQQQAPRRTRQQ